MYVGLSNVVLRLSNRLSNGVSKGKGHAVLISSHPDSMLLSPSAADDALAVRVSEFLLLPAVFAR